MGKSAIVQAVAKELGFEVRTLIASTCDPVDLRGVIRIQDDFTTWVPPKFFDVDPKKKVLFFFDELNTATPSVQAAFFRIILEGKLDNVDISNSPRIGAGNRQTDMAAAQRMPTPLVSRFCHMTLEPSLDDWKEWAYTAGIRSEVIAFLNFRQDLLHQMPKDRDTPFPTPRTWDFLSRVMECHGEVGQEVIGGIVGTGPAAEFVGFWKVYSELPKTPEEILTGGKTFKQPDRQYAVNGILANHFRNNQKKDVADSILKYSYNLDEEFAVVLMKDCVHINRIVLATSGEFRKWSQKYQDIVL